MTNLLSFLLGLAQLINCVSPRLLPRVAEPLRDLALVHGGDLITESQEGGDASLTFTLSRWRDGLEEKLLTLPGEQYYRGEALVVTEDSWWYSEERPDTAGEAVMFVMPNGDNITTTRVAIPREEAAPTRWIPLRSKRPSGVLLSASSSGPLRVSSVSLDGVRALGEISGSGFAPQRGSAELLPGDRVLLVSADGGWPPASRVMLRLFDGRGAVTETLLPSCNIGPLSAIATSVDSRGSLCIVATSQEGKIVAAIVNVDHSDATTWRALSSDDDRAILPQVVSVKDHFIAAWLRSSAGRVCARELTPDGWLSPKVDLSTGADINDGLLIGRANADSAVFFIRERRSGLTMHTLPLPIAGHLFCSRR